MRVPEGQEKGFALVEACAALGVLALVAAMFAGVMQSAAMTGRHAAQTREAVMIARSQLALATAAARGGERGRWGPYAWRVAVTDYPSARGAGLEQVTVRVSGARVGGTPVGGGPVGGEPRGGQNVPLVELGTLRLAR